jgi:hypothetical protein
MWPTPTVQDAENLAGPSQWNRNSDPLNVAVQRGMLPTPKSSPSGPDYARRSRDGSGGDDLATAIGGQLNPVWVNWLMNFPLTWHAESVSEVLTWIEQFLELPKGSLDGCRGSDQTGMLSSQKSRSGSAKESLKR